MMSASDALAGQQRRDTSGRIARDRLARDPAGGVFHRDLLGLAEEGPRAAG